MVDSFTVAILRDQEGRPFNRELVKKNVKKNAELFIWTFDNYGFPSNQKIGRIGNENVFIAMPTLLSHMITSDVYPMIRKKVLEFVKSGDCPPQDYALMIDTYDTNKNTGAIFHYRENPTLDSAQINKNRRSIGLPSLQHNKRIRLDKYGKK